MCTCAKFLHQRASVVGSATPSKTDTDGQTRSGTVIDDLQERAPAPAELPVVYNVARPPHARPPARRTRSLSIRPGLMHRDTQLPVGVIRECFA